MTAEIGATAQHFSPLLLRLPLLHRTAGIAPGGVAAGDPDTGETYYLHWLATLEGLVASKGVASTETLHRYRDAWDHAADRTPHGKPIELREEDFR